MSLPTEPRLNGPAVHGDLVNRVQQLRLDNQIGTGRQRSGGSWLPWVLCGLLAVTWAGVGVRWYKATPTGDRPEGGAPAAKPGTAPAAGEAAIPPGEVVFVLKGNLIPSLQIAVSPIDVAGEVTEITFVEGKRVKKGELLAKIRDNRYRNEFNTSVATLASGEARVTKAKAALASAEARVTKMKAILVRAERDFEQAEQQRASGSIADQEYRRAKADKEVADAEQKSAVADVDAALKEITAAEADVGAAQARREEAKRMLDNCTIPAPIDGTVLTKKADVGSLVNPLAFSSTNGGSSGSLCEIADLAKLEVEVDVPERQITKVRPGLDCQIVADADPNRPYRGRIDRVMPIADDSKNVIKIRVQVVLPPGEEPGSFLKPKMSVTVTAYNRDSADKK
jgi:multidrug resistance efflux pump